MRDDPGVIPVGPVESQVLEIRVPFPAVVRENVSLEEGTEGCHIADHEDG